MTLEVKGHYDEVFDIEIEGWCYGITHFPGEVTEALIYRVIKEITPAFCKAVDCFHIFDRVVCVDAICITIFPAVDRFSDFGGFSA